MNRPDGTHTSLRDAAEKLLAMLEMPTLVKPSGKNANAGFIDMRDWYALQADVNALRVALSTPHAEGWVPVAWMIRYSDGARIAVFEPPSPAMFEACKATITPLAAIPPKDSTADNNFMPEGWNPHAPTAGGASR